MAKRDPFTDPRSGDLFSATIGGIESTIWIQFVKGGEVFLGPVEGEICYFGGSRWPLERFTEECRKAGARLLNA
jgi:hypothetical protein